MPIDINLLREGESQSLETWGARGESRQAAANRPAPAGRMPPAPHMAHWGSARWLILWAHQ